MSNQNEFEIENGVLKKYNGIGGDVVIPNEVTKIAADVFYNNQTITSVVLPNSLLEIGKSAFWLCKKLTGIKIPASVSLISEDAFVWCNSIDGFDVNVANNNYCSENGILYTKDKKRLLFVPRGYKRDTISIPASVEHIGEYAFCAAVKALTSITVDTANKYFESDENGVLYTKGKTEIIRCPVGTSMVSYRIPNGVKKIWYNAFSECSSVTDISINEDIEKIGTDAFYNTGYYNDTSNWEDDVLYLDGHLLSAKKKISDKYVIKSGTKTIAASAFRNCKEIVSVFIPDGVSILCDSAFSGCEKLETIAIPSTVYKICEYAFSGCSSLTEVSLRDGVTEIEKYAFSSCVKLVDISLPKGLKGIPEGLFWKSSALNRVIVPEGITQIGSYAFSGCLSLTEIKLPSTVTVLDKNAFSNCSALSDIVLPDGLKTIGKSAFLKCGALKFVSIPSSVEEIGEYAFQGCSALTSLAIPQTDIKIGKYAFSQCTELTGIKLPQGLTEFPEGLLWQDEKIIGIQIPEGITKIGDSAFSGTSITSIVIPEGVTVIEGSAFLKCQRLNSVTLPSTLTDIGAFAFQDSAITSLDLPSSVKRIEKYALSLCGNLTEMVLPRELKEISAGLFWKSGNLKSVVIPKGVEKIGNVAFKECVSLEKVVFDSGIKEIGTEAFISCSALKDVRITSDSDGASVSGVRLLLDVVGLENVTSISLPQQTLEIESGMFDGCTGLKSITLPDSIVKIADFDLNSDSITLSKISELAEAAGSRLGDLLYNAIIELVFKKGNKQQICSICYGYLDYLGNNSFLDEKILEYKSDIVGMIQKNNDILGLVRMFDTFDFSCDEYDSLIETSEGYPEIKLYLISKKVERYNDQNYDGEISTLCRKLFGMVRDDNGYVVIRYSGNADTVIIPGKVKGRAVAEIAGGAFKGCKGVKNVYISEGTSKIKAFAFSGCKDLRIVTFPSSVTQIGIGAFNGCTNLLFQAPKGSFAESYAANKGIKCITH